MQIIDITAELTLPAGIFSGDPAATVTDDKRISSGDPFNTSLISCGTHSGTHLDVPFHFIEEGAKLSSVGLHELCGWVYVVEIGHDGPITDEVLASKGIAASANKLLLKRSRDRLDAAGDTQVGHQGLSVSGASWLLNNGATLVGLESYNIDYEETPAFPVHHLLLSQNVLILEGLQLDQVEEGWYTLFCLPLKIGDVDGAPVRAVLVTN